MTVADRTPIQRLSIIKRSTIIRKKIIMKVRNTNMNMCISNMSTLNQLLRQFYKKRKDFNS